MTEPKETDFCIIQGWMLRLGLNATELSIFAKIYGFTQDGEGTCKSSEEYLSAWGGKVDRKTVYNALKSLEEKNLIRISHYTVNGRKRNKYTLGTIPPETDDSSFAVKNKSFCTIQHWQLGLGLKSNDLRIYAIIHQFSQDGVSVCTASHKYFMEWCGCDRTTVFRTIKKLEQKELIRVNRKTKVDIEYWSSKSREGGRGQGMLQNSPCNEKQDVAKFPNRMLQNSPCDVAKFPNRMLQNSPLNLSSNERVNLSGSKRATAKTTKEIKKQIVKCLDGTRFKFLSQDPSFLSKAEEWADERKIDCTKLSSYLSGVMEKMGGKDDPDSLALFRHIFFSESDWLKFSEHYDEESRKKADSERNIRMNTVICPVCGKSFTKYKGFGYCCDCGLEEKDLENEDIIAEKIRIRSMSEGDRKRLEEELIRNLLPTKNLMRGVS